MRTPDEIGKAHGFINGHSIQSISTNIIRDFREAILDAQKEAWNEAIKAVIASVEAQYDHNHQRGTFSWENKDRDTILKLLK